MDAARMGGAEKYSFCAQGMDRRFQKANSRHSAAGEVTPYLTQFVPKEWEAGLHKACRARKLSKMVYHAEAIHRLLHTANVFHAVRSNLASSSLCESSRERDRVTETGMVSAVSCFSKTGFNLVV